jgi:hypothetical protein
MPTIQTFGYISLAESVNKIIRPKSFLRDMFFKRRMSHPTTTVQVDILTGGQKKAPFVKRGNPATVVGKTGQQTHIVEPPNIRLKKYLTATDLLFTRGAGMPIHVVGGSKDPIATARMERIGLEQQEMLNTITRTEEYMASQALQGSFTITQDDLQFSIDFLMPAGNKPTLAGGNKWDAPDTATPLKNIRTWKNVAKKASGKIPTIAVMTTDVWNLFIACKEVKEYLDNRRIDLGKIETNKDILESGAELKAQIENVTYYTYDEYYDDGAGNLVSMVATDKVLLLSPNADTRLHYGAIEDLDAGVNFVGQLFSKDWIEKDPSLYWLLVETHPLPAVHEPEAFISAKVA